MSGPWEAYQGANEPEAAGPWQSYSPGLDLNALSPVQRTLLLRQPADPSTLAKVGTFVKEGALPMAGQMFGAAMGAPGGPVGMLAAESAGAAGGEYLNQRLGIKPRSVVDPKLDYGDIAWAGASPGIGRGLYAGGKELLNRGSRVLPGAGAALQEFGANTARRVMGKLKARIPDSDALYKIVDKYNPVIDTPHTLKALQDLNQHYASNVPNVMAGAAPVQEVQKLTREWMEEMAGTGLHPQQSFQKLRGALKLMNEDYGTSSGTLRHAYGEIKKAVWKDLEAAAARPTNQLSNKAAMALRMANRAFRRELAYDALQDVVEKQAIGVPRSGDLMQGFNRKPILKAIEQNPTIKDNLSPGELAYIRMAMQRLGHLPQLPPAPGQHVGSSRTLVAGSLGGLAGFFSPYPGGAATGAAGGPLAMEAISKLLETEAGKNLILRAAYAKGPTWGPQAAAALAAGAAGGMTPQR